MLGGSCSGLSSSPGCGLVTNQVNNGSSGQGKRLVLLSPGSGCEAPEMIHVTHSFSEFEERLQSRLNERGK